MLWRCDQKTSLAKPIPVFIITLWLQLMKKETINLPTHLLPLCHHHHRFLLQLTMIGATHCLAFIERYASILLCNLFVSLPSVYLAFPPSILSPLSSLDSQRFPSKGVRIANRWLPLQGIFLKFVKLEEISMKYISRESCLASSFSFFFYWFLRKTKKQQQQKVKRKKKKQKMKRITINLNQW